MNHRPSIETDITVPTVLSDKYYEKNSKDLGLGCQDAICYSGKITYMY